MSLHRLTRVTMGVPNVDQTVAYYAEFGLTHNGGGSFTTQEGGEQLKVVHAPTRRLVEIGVGVDSPDDLAAILLRRPQLRLHLRIRGRPTGRHA